MNKIGDKIREARKDMHLSRKDLAEKLNISASALANYENGYRQPNPEILSTISKALYLPFIELMPSLDESEIYKELIEEANRRDNPCPDDMKNYIKALDKKNLIFNLAYTEMKASDNAKRNIIKHILLESNNEYLYEQIFENKDTLDTEINELYKYMSMSLEVSAVNLIKNRNFRKLENKRNNIRFRENVRKVISGESTLEGSPGAISKDKTQTIAVLEELLFSLESNGHSDELINTIDTLINTIEDKTT